MLEAGSVSALTLNELSRRVGLAKSNVLRYFESREQILLELLDQTWKRWLAELPAQLAADVDPRAPASQRAEQFAGALTASLAPHPVLCDLLTSLAAVLEHNVSAEVAARYKTATLANITTLAKLTDDLFPELAGRTFRLCGQAMMAISIVWIHSHPSGAVLAAYEADPSLALARLDFSPALQEMIATLIAGTLARTRPPLAPPPS